MEAASEGEGKGATFVVRLPVLPVYQNTPTSNFANQLNAGKDADEEGANDLAGLKVLVVDDEADTCELLRSLLSKCGAEVTAARSAREAFELLKLVQPDVMVSDIGMSQEDGYELMRKVRALPQESGGNVPAVALTAYGAN